jgi:hypothetical protein
VLQLLCANVTIRNWHEYNNKACCDEVLLHAPQRARLLSAGHGAGALSPGCLAKESHRRAADGTEKIKTFLRKGATHANRKHGLEDNSIVIHAKAHIHEQGISIRVDSRLRRPDVMFFDYFDIACVAPVPWAAV